MNRLNASILVVVILFFAWNFGYKEYLKSKLLNDGLLHVYFLNIGQGDGFLIKTPNKNLILIDGGPDETVLFRLNKILPFWVNHIDTVLISHFHRDHYLGGYYLKEYLNVSEVLYPDQFEYNEKVLLLFDGFDGLAAGEKKQKKYLNINQNAVYGYGVDVEFFVYKIEPSVKPISENFKSLVCLLDYKDFEVLFTGDAPPSLQKAAQRYLEPNQVEVLKVPHQGSKYDLNPDFIDYLNPKEAIVSIGKNSYGHPHKEVLEFYKNRGIPLYRTDYAKEFIFVKTDGYSYQIDYY
jgi:competence protein ComEC